MGEKTKVQLAEEKALREAKPLAQKTIIEGFGKLPRAETSKDKNPVTVDEVHLPGIQIRAKQAGKKISQDLIKKYIIREKPTMPELLDWAEAPFIGNKGGVVAKKTEGFKHGGLAGTGHNDMRKGGLFR